MLHLALASGQCITVTLMVDLISNNNTQVGPAHCYATDLRKEKTCARNRDNLLLFLTYQRYTFTHILQQLTWVYTNSQCNEV